MREERREGERKRETHRETERNGVCVCEKVCACMGAHVYVCVCVHNAVVLNGFAVVV